jgi:hypothetical protein
MMSVNLALAQLVAAPVVFANMESAGTSFAGLLTYDDTVSTERLETSAVIGWGDFIHCIEWAKHDLVKRLRKTKGLGSDAVLRQWYGLYMLRDVKPQHAISYGSTLYINSMASYADSQYEKALRMLHAKCGLLSFRDPVSSSQLRDLLGIDASCGCDCAMFLDCDNIPRFREAVLPSGLVDKRYIVTSIGRSGCVDLQMRFLSSLSQELNVPLVQLDWLNTKSDDELVTSLKILRHAKLCVTDIYHLCVNAIRERVPVFGFYRSGLANDAIDDEKKRLFFYGYGLREYLIDLDQLLFAKTQTHVAAFVREVARMANDKSVLEAISDRILSSVARHRQALMDELL